MKQQMQILKPNASIVLPHQQPVQKDTRIITAYLDKRKQQQQANKVLGCVLENQIEVEPPNSTSPTTRAQYLPA
jgi:hypothetical protein